MVEDRITDGKRIAQLLASELTGLESAPMDRVSVVDATPDVEPTPDGVAAYGVAVDDDRVGTVTVFPDAACLSITADLPTTRAAGVTVERDDGETTVRIEHGAAVKTVVDLLVRTINDGSVDR